MKYICLIDCDNFFASCEKIFHPKFRNKPLVVAGGKNGIVIARSKEAKALGIPMCGAVFEYRSLFNQEDVIVRSPNFALYKDISKRIKETVNTFGFKTFVYSIDEMFLEIPKKDFSPTLIQAIQTKIKKWTGIDVSIGVSTTKTLAKMATGIAKKRNSRQKILFEKEEIAKVLKDSLVKDVWGIGRKSAQKLKLHKIQTAHDFISTPETSLKKLLGIYGLRTKKELEGESASSFFEIAKDKSMQITRSFPTEIVSIEKIKEILSSFIEQGCEKLRKMEKKAEGFSLFVESSRFKERKNFTKTFTLDEPSNDTSIFLALKEEALFTLTEGSISIKRAGIHFFCLIDGAYIQKNFLVPQKPQSASLMKTLDSINKKYGKKSLHFASSSKKSTSKTSLPKLYTTCWDQLLQIRI